MYTRLILIAAGLVSAALVYAAIKLMREPTSDRYDFVPRAAVIGEARNMVLSRMGEVHDAKFTDEIVAVRDGVSLVCGTAVVTSPLVPDTLRQRYLAIVGHEVFIEIDVGRDDMDRAFEEYCRREP